MTRLLVSVRDLREAEIAVAAGAGWLDLKEPRRGALGAVEFETADEVVARFAGSVPVSVAWGELLELAPDSAGRVPRGTRAAKVGLARCARRADWPDRWQSWAGSLPAGVMAVAVIYADWRQAQAPSPDDVLDSLRTADVVLVDTWRKTGESLVDLWPAAERRRVIERARRAGKLVALAGSLREEHFESALAHEPDIIAVRGAACSGGREGTVSADRVRALVERLSSARIAAI